MDNCLKSGFSFGLTSGNITTLGLMIGLYSGTNSKLAVIGGILTIAIADSFSDALGVHIAEESENIHTKKQIWISTITTLSTKFFFTLTFMIPVLLLDLQLAVIASIIWGGACLTVLSYFIARESGENPWKVICEHLLIGAVVICLTFYVGKFVAYFFAQ